LLRSPKDADFKDNVQSHYSW